MCCSQLRELLRQVPACSDGACAHGMLMDLGVSSMQVRPARASDWLPQIRLREQAVESLLSCVATSQHATG